MQDRVGEEYDGIVSGWSISVCSCSSRACRSTGCCTYRHSARIISRATARVQDCGRSSGKVYKLGDRLRVRVTKVSLDDRRIDFELAGEFEPPRRASPRFLRQGARRRTLVRRKPAGPRHGGSDAQAIAQSHAPAVTYGIHCRARSIDAQPQRVRLLWFAAGRRRRACRIASAGAHGWRADPRD
jgi:hypothetical protein